MIHIGLTKSVAFFRRSSGFANLRLFTMGFVKIAIGVNRCGSMELGYSCEGIGVVGVATAASVQVKESKSKREGCEEEGRQSDD